MTCSSWPQLYVCDQFGHSPAHSLNWLGSYCFSQSLTVLHVSNISMTVMYDTIKNSKKWLDQGIPKLWCLCCSLAVMTEMKWPWWLVPVVRLEYLLALVYSSVLMTTSMVAKVTSVGNWITLRHPYIVSLWWVTSQIMFFYNSLFCHILFHHAHHAAVGVCDWDRKELTECSIAHCLCSNAPFMFSCSLQLCISPKEWCNATIAT